MRHTSLSRYVLLFISILALSTSCNSLIDEEQALFPVKEFGRWGYIDSKGNKIIDCQYRYAGYFSEGLAAIQKDDSLWGFIDNKGRIVIEPKFTYSEVAEPSFINGLCQLELKTQTENKKIFINQDGSIAFEIKPEFGYVGNFNSGRARVVINEEVCFLNKKGEVVIHTGYPYGASFSEGFANVWTGDSCAYIDTTGIVIARFPSMGNQDFKEGLAMIHGLYYINTSGKKAFVPDLLDLVHFDFSDGMAQVCVPGEDNSTGFIDKTGKLVIPTKFSVVEDFHEGLAAFMENEKWGFINKTGSVIIQPQFDYVRSGFRDGLCEVEKDGAWGYINSLGEFKWQAQKEIQYGTINLQDWRLDTASLTRPLVLEDYNFQNSPPRKGKFDNVKGFAINVDTSKDITVFADRFIAHKLYIMNGSMDSVELRTQDGNIMVIHQALNQSGEWQDINQYGYAFCGLSFDKIKLRPEEYLVLSCPILKGNFKTTLRFKIEMKGKTDVYSNTYIGFVNTKQFTQHKSV